MATDDTRTGTPRISKRALDRIIDLHQQMTRETRSLAAHHSRLIGAMLACDAQTQRSMIIEYRDRLYAVHQAIAALSLIIDRHGHDSETG
jgi:hypothetical protein